MCGLGVSCVGALFVNYSVMLYGVWWLVPFACVVFARFACDVWRDGVGFVMFLLLCVCVVV